MVSSRSQNANFGDEPSIGLRWLSRKSQSMNNGLMLKRSIGPTELARLIARWQAADSGPIYERLAAALRAAVLDGRLPVGCRLPAERALATELALSRTTVTAAYRKLSEAGFLVARQGSGSVTAMPPGRPRSWAHFGPRLDPGDDTIDLAIASCAPVSAAALQAAVESAAAALPGYLAGVATPAEHGYHPAGIPALRRIIAEHYTARGLPTTPEQILVTTGGQGAIDLLARHLLGRGDVAVIESPTYPNAIEALRSAGARLAGVPVPAEGYDSALLVETLRTTRPRLAYVVPEFHNPTGALLPAEARLRLVEAARSASTLLIADEVMVDLALDRQELPPPLAAFDTDGRVIAIGSMSKAYWGGLRIGWIRAGTRMIEELAAARAPIDLASPAINQLIGAALLERAGELVPAQRELLAQRRDHLEGLLAERFPEWSWTRPAGGLCLWVDLGAPISTSLTAAAERAGLRLASGTRFGIDGAFERRLRVPFTLSDQDTELAVERLAEAAGDLRSGRPTLGSVPTVA
jgi:DNA-binding transcriptional MocR family regulator